MGELKPGWRSVKFGEVVRLGKERCDPAVDGIERYIGLEHIEPGDLRVRSWGEVSDGTTFTTRVRPGHVLFGKRRAYQRKVAVADFDAVCSGDIYVFESANPGKLLPELLPFLCQTDAFFDYAVGTSAGSLSPRTNWTSLAEYEFALPPLEEQRRIARVCEAMVTCETTLAITSEAATGVALAGTLSMLGVDFAAGGSSLTAKLVLPRNWRLTTIGGLVRPRDQGVQVGPFGGSLASRHYSPSGVEVLKVHNVGHDGYIDRSKFVHVSTAYASELARYAVRADDVVVVAQGDTTGRVAMVREQDAGALISQHLIRVRLDSETVSARWLCGFMRSPLFLEQASRVMKKSTRPGLNTSDILEMRIPLPPRAEQEERADHIQRLLSTSAQFRTRRVQLLQARLALLNRTLADTAA